MTGSVDDVSHMRAALALARRGLGCTWPNPPVGCVIVQRGRVVGRAVTEAGGRPHAEPQALAMAGEAARGATVYVTLEPCRHHGGTPPCTDALISAGVARVVVAIRDSDSRVNGSGIARLREAGIVVEEGLLGDVAQELTAGFFSRIKHGRPLLTLKLATSLDGRIATAGGSSRWITGEAARRAAHRLRGRHDAIMVGIGTVLADDPDLTCRLEGFRAAAPIRLIVDGHLRTPDHSRLVATAAQTPTWILTRPDADPTCRGRLQDAGVTVLPISSSSSEGHVDLLAALHRLGDYGLTRVLVEGGARLAGSLLRADVVDRLAWFHAPGVIGADGLPAAQALGVVDVAQMLRFVRRDAQPVGDDMLTELRRAA